MIESDQYNIGAVSACTTCWICREPILLPHPSASVPNICEECAKRLQKILYPPEITFTLNTEELLQHVGYDSDQLGRDK